MTCPAHRWRIAQLPTDGAFAARCSRCGAERTFPVTPQVAYNAGFFARGAGQARQAQRAHAELIRQAAEVT